MKTYCRQSSVSAAVILLFISLCTSSTDWSETRFRTSYGHYPSLYCQFTDVALDPVERSFLYRSSVDHHSGCSGVHDIWSLRNVNTTSVSCDETYDVGQVFTIYYWGGGSNYFHLHYDMMIPLYQAVYFGRETGSDNKSYVFMPTVEKTRLQVF